jgi:hypothetical protein
MNPSPSVPDQTSSSQFTPKPANGTRVVIALTCWLFSGIGVLMSLMLMGNSIAALLTRPLTKVLHEVGFYLGLGIPYAWLSLAVMTGGWVGNTRVNWHWPLMGGMVGLLCMAYAAPFILLYFPCVFLGIYLIYFHLGADIPSKQDSASEIR